MLSSLAKMWEWSDIFVCLWDGASTGTVQGSITTSAHSKIILPSIVLADWLADRTDPVPISSREWGFDQTLAWSDDVQSKKDSVRQADKSNVLWEAFSSWQGGQAGAVCKAQEPTSNTSCHPSVTEISVIVTCFCIPLLPNKSFHMLWYFTFKQD